MTVKELIECLQLDGYENGAEIFVVFAGERYELLGPASFDDGSVVLVAGLKETRDG